MTYDGVTTTQSGGEKAGARRQNKLMGPPLISPTPYAGVYQPEVDRSKQSPGVGLRRPAGSGCVTLGGNSHL